MSLLKLLLPPLFQLLCLILVFISLLSPAPYHSSSISLIYISPAPMKNATRTPTVSTEVATVEDVSSIHPSLTVSPFPSNTDMQANTMELGFPSATLAKSQTSEPSARLRMQRRDISSVAGQQPMSNIRFSIGLLGSCYTNADNVYECTSARIPPHFNTSMLENNAGVHMNTEGLPQKLGIEPVLVLLCFLVLCCTSAWHFRRVHRQATKKTMSSARLILTYRVITHVQDVMALVLLLDIIALRVHIARAADEFNTLNKDQALGPAALSQPSQIPLSLTANAGTAFSCICFSAIVFALLSAWERHCLKRETKTDAAHHDAPMWWSRLTCAPLSEFVHPKKRLSISAPMPISSVPKYTPYAPP